MNEWEPIAFVRSPRKDLTDDHWGDVVVEIELAEGVPTESLAGLDQFSHIEVFYLFHHAEPDAEFPSISESATSER